MSAQPAICEERLLIVGDLERLAPAARRCFSPFRIDAIKSYLAAIAEAGRVPTSAILIGVDPHCRRLESAVAALRQVCKTARIVLCCEPAYESWGRRAVEAGADEYLIYPPCDSELERALGLPGRVTRERWSRLRPGDARVAAGEIELLADTVAELHMPAQHLARRMAELVCTALTASWTTVMLDDIIGTFKTSDAVAEDQQAALIQRIGGAEQPRGQLLVGPRGGGGYGVDDARKLEHYATLVLRLADSAARLHRWREQASTDDLTGLGNRRYLMSLLHDLVERAGHHRFSITVLIFDIDDFKRYNDTYGHAAGDDILRETGQLFTKCCRKGDVVCRLGGDEFVVVFSDPSPPRMAGSRHPPGVVTVLNRFKDALKAHQFARLGPEALGRLTISGGLATYPWQARTPRELLQRADEALLEAKAGGKNSFWLVGAGDVCKAQPDGLQ